MGSRRRITKDLMKAKGVQTKHKETRYDERGRPYSVLVSSIASTGLRVKEA
ncbi:hypothetical protein STSP2_03135 [Anaerohalosphaera lusitana]|uniref:Uncharacterized protein n=1 Tax=Anaerohalosphaera lusitana TaxID=1936003 RepID=A0A1U9NQ34_9BACT|nr:hypothetical protein [Anaerohalosphaera lusitana]AQT69935.1 hypothetical protein STSP2_03135 [Anaerohalosphaera lusitana]